MNIMQQMIENLIARQEALVENWLVKHSEICTEKTEMLLFHDYHIELRCARHHTLELITTIGFSVRSTNGPYSIKY